MRCLRFAENVSGAGYLRIMTSADGSGVIRFHDEGLARRLKALACTVPPHDLDAMDFDGGAAGRSARKRLPGPSGTLA